MAYCYICKVQDSSISHHIFPKNPTLNRQWLKFFSFKRDDVFPSTRICAKHFPNDCFTIDVISGRRNLKRGSIPSLLNKRIRKRTLNFISKPAQTPNNEFAIKHSSISTQEVENLHNYADQIDVNSSLILNGNDSTDIFLEVKPEQPQILYLVQSHNFSLESSNVLSENIMFGEQSKDAIIGKKAENTTLMPLMEKSNVNIFNSITSCNTKDISDNEDQSRSNYLAMENYICNICKKSFTTTGDMRDHLKFHADKFNSKCKFCGTDFANRNKLLTHVKYCCNRKNYKCDTCVKSFKTRHHVMIHMKRHVEERNHNCDVCTKSFKNRKELVLHKKRHTGERNHKCDICTKRFKSRSELTQHTKRHTSERNHVCNICNKRFKLRHDLLLHVICHTKAYKHSMKDYEEGQKFHVSFRNEIDEEESLQKLDTHPTNESNVKVKEENLCLPDDVMETNPTIINNANPIILMHVKCESPELLHLSETYSNSVIIKEEENIASLMDTNIELSSMVKIKSEDLSNVGSDGENTFECFVNVIDNINEFVDANLEIGNVDAWNKTSDAN